MSNATSTKIPESKLMKRFIGTENMTDEKAEANAR